MSCGGQPDSDDEGRQVVKHLKAEFTYDRSSDSSTSEDDRSSSSSLVLAPSSLMVSEISSSSQHNAQAIHDEISDILASAQPLVDVRVFNSSNLQASDEFCGILISQRISSGTEQQYEHLRALIIEEKTRYALTRRHQQPKCAELYALIFTGLFQIFDELADEITMESALHFTQLYRETLELHEELLLTKLYVDDECPSLNLGILPIAFDAELGRKLFPILFTSAPRTSLCIDNHHFLNRSNDDLAKPTTMYDAIVWHALDDRRFFHIYVNAMLSHVSIALYNKHVYTANIIMRFVFSSRCRWQFS